MKINIFVGGVAQISSAEWDGQDIFDLLPSTFNPEAGQTIQLLAQMSPSGEVEIDGEMYGWEIEGVEEEE